MPRKAQKTARPTEGIEVVLAAVEIANMGLKGGYVRDLTTAERNRIDSLIETLPSVDPKGFNRVQNFTSVGSHDTDAHSLIQRLSQSGGTGPVSSQEIEGDLDWLREWLTAIARRASITRRQYHELAEAVTNLKVRPRVTFVSYDPNNKTPDAEGRVVRAVNWHVTGLRSLTAAAVLDLLDEDRGIAARLYNCRYTGCRRFGFDLTMREKGRFPVNCPETDLPVDGSTDHGNAARRQVERIPSLRQKQDMPPPRAARRA